jgi:mannose-6-phosphate isomerase-like protein (cupin superfamily)
MQITLFSPNYGKSLWPLTNGVRGVQFLKLLPGDVSQAERMVAGLRAEYPEVRITFAAPQSQMDSIRSQFGEDVDITLIPEDSDCAEHDKKLSGFNSWSELPGEMGEASLGIVTQEDTRNTLVINELGIPVVALGTQNLVIAASPDGILVSDKAACFKLKPIAEALKQPRPMYEERRWGEYTVLAQKEHCLVKNLFIAAGKSISLQAHNHRSEVWVITKGEGSFTLDDETWVVRPGDVLKIETGQKHKMAGITDLYFTEVQLGDKFDESDIMRFDLSADGVTI